MFDEISYTEDPVNAFEERRLLRQVVSNGVGYRFQRPELCQDVISDANRFYLYIRRTVRSANHLGSDCLFLENKRRFQNRDNGYYLIDMDSNRLLAEGKQLRIKSVVIGFTSYVTDESVLIGNRRWAYIPIPNAIVCDPETDSLPRLIVSVIDLSDDSGYFIDHRIGPQTKVQRKMASNIERICDYAQEGIKMNYIVDIENGRYVSAGKDEDIGSCLLCLSGQRHQDHYTDVRRKPASWIVCVRR